MPLVWDHCAACTRRRLIPGVGPLPCSTLLLGEGGGWEENRALEPFVGKSGRELNGQYLPMSGLSRGEVRIENASQCYHDDPDIELVTCCSEKFLPGILRKCQPQLVVTLGAMALAQFGDYTLEMEHGYPIEEVSYGDWTGTLFPCYHPAAGLHQSSFMIPLQEDFANLWLYRHGRLKRPVDEYPNPCYRILRTPEALALALLLPALRGASEIAIDTEYIAGRIWCLSFSQEPGTGYVIKADNPDVVACFREWLAGRRPLVHFHHWLTDVDKLRQLGITDYRWKDTMVSSYHLGSTPQALKVLAYRLCGMRMQDYDDLVLPYAKADATKWLLEVATHPIQSYIEAQPWRQKTARCSGGGKAPDGTKYRKHVSAPVYFDEPVEQPCILCSKPKKAPAMERDKGGRTYPWDRAAKILGDLAARPATNPFTRWDKVPELERAVVEEVFGPMPRPTIDRVPEEEIERYAGRDADATLRVNPVLKRLGRDVVRRVRRCL